MFSTTRTSSTRTNGRVFLLGTISCFIIIIFLFSFDSIFSSSSSSTVSSPSSVCEKSSSAMRHEVAELRLEIKRLQEQIQLSSSPSTAPENDAPTTTSNSNDITMEDENHASENSILAPIPKPLKPTPTPFMPEGITGLHYCDMVKPGTTQLAQKVSLGLDSSDWDGKYVNDNRDYFKTYYKRERRVARSLTATLKKSSGGQCMLDAFTRNYFDLDDATKGVTYSSIFSSSSSSSTTSSSSMLLPDLIVLGFHLSQGETNIDSGHNVLRKFIKSFYSGSSSIFQDRQSEKFQGSDRQQLHLVFDDKENARRTRDFIRNHIFGATNIDKFNEAVADGKIQIIVVGDIPILKHKYPGQRSGVTRGTNLRVYHNFAYMQRLLKKYAAKFPDGKIPMNQSPRIVSIDTRDVFFRGDENRKLAPLSMMFERFAKFRNAKKPFAFFIHEYVPLAYGSINQVWLKHIFQTFTGDEQGFLDDLLRYDLVGEEEEQQHADRMKKLNDILTNYYDKKTSTPPGSRLTVNSQKFFPNPHNDIRPFRHFPRPENEFHVSINEVEANQPFEDHLLRTLNSGVIAGDVMGLLNMYGMIRGVFECMRKSPLGDHSDDHGIDQGAELWAVAGGIQIRLLHQYQQQQKRKGEEEEEEEQQQKRIQSASFDVYIVNFKVGPLTHYQTKNKFPDYIMRTRVIENGTQARLISKNHTEFYNCLDEPYAIVHQLDRWKEYFARI